MEDRLNQIAERLRQVERELADPAVYSDQQRLKNLSREQKELTPVVETFTALQQTEQAIAEAREMLSDPELRELAQEELTRTKEQRERLRRFQRDTARRLNAELGRVFFIDGQAASGMKRHAMSTDRTVRIDKAVKNITVVFIEVFFG